jgi:hypothetical protein
MRIAHLAVGDRGFYLPPDEVEFVMAAAALARKTGEWLDLRDAGGKYLRLLIPTQALLVLHEYEVDDPDPGADTTDWTNYDYEL